MADIVEILAIAAISAIVTLLVRELFAWKFSELERGREKLEMLLEKVYGPIRVVTWRMDRDEKTTNKYWITNAEFSEIQRIVFMYSYEFDPDYRNLLDFFLNEFLKQYSVLIGMELEKEVSISDTRFELSYVQLSKPKIKELIKVTEEKYENVNKGIEKLHNMRKGVINNLKFIFLIWRF